MWFCEITWQTKNTSSLLSAYKYQTWHSGNLPWEAPKILVIINHVVLIAWQTKNICITTTKIPVVTKFGKVVTYHEELPQGLTYHKEQSTHKFVWPLNEVIVLGHVINWIQYISTCRRPMDTKLGKLQTYQWEAVWPFNYVMHLTWEFEKFIFSLSKYLWPVNQAGC